MEGEGSLEQVAGRWRLRFVRTLAHPPERVWRALTEPEHLAVWFPTEIHGERAAGAALRFVFAGDEGPPIAGQMLVYDPPAVLEFRWGEETLRFQLEPQGAGCRLTFLNTFDEQGKAARDAAGWHACLDVLACHLDGREPPGGPNERWAQLHPVYVERFGPEGATVGPPAGHPAATG